MAITSTRNIRHAPMKLSSPATTNSSHPPCSSPSAVSRIQTSPTCREFHGVDGASNRTWTPPQSTAPRASRVRPWSDPSDTEAKWQENSWMPNDVPLANDERKCSFVCEKKKILTKKKPPCVARVPGASSEMFHEYDSTYGSMSLTFIPKSLMMRECALCAPATAAVLMKARPGRMSAERTASYSTRALRSSPQHRKAYDTYCSYNNVICCRR
ncbi:hypothetical protein H4582DRAFT_2001547 [Lactarius indigo]|nr:hypothetical protein H4582DRAFT_2001547 [Lactarius indigo]